MFIKAKYKIWFTILAVCVICSVLMRVIPQIKANKEEKKKNEVSYTIQMDTKDQALNSRISNQTITAKGKDVTFIHSNLDPDIIVTDKSEEHAGYEKMEGGLYTTFTLFANKYLYKGYDDNWLNKSNEHDTDKYSKDIRLLLEAIEHKKNWNDIGAENNYIVKPDEPVKLYIPTKYHYSYDSLRMYIAVALNDYEPLNDENAKELTKRADKILEESKQIELSAFVEESDIYGLLLAPESTVAECRNIFKNYTRGIIYPGKSIKIQYDVYVKPDKLNDFRELMSSNDFFNLFGLRSIYGNHTGEKNCMFEKCFDVVDSFDYVGTELPVSVTVPETTEVEKVPSAEETETEDVTSEDVTEDEDNETEKESESENAENSTEEEAKHISGGFFLFLLFIVILLMIVLVISS